MMTIQRIVYLYFKGTYMTNAAPNASAATPATSAETRQIVLKEVGVKWSKFSEPIS